MAFRIKITNKSLNINQAPPVLNDKINVVALLETERQTGTNFLEQHFATATDTNQSNNNRPKVGTSQGMAIRSSNGIGVSDYM